MCCHFTYASLFTVVVEADGAAVEAVAAVDEVAQSIADRHGAALDVPDVGGAASAIEGIALHLRPSGSEILDTDS